MRVIKCDLCKKNIKGEAVTAGVGFFPKAELCEKCGKPILKFLRRYRFIEREKKKTKK